MIFTFLGKTVSTGQITVMGNMQAQCFDYCLSIFSKFFYYIFIYISGKQHTLLFQLPTFGNRSTDISLRILILQSVYDLLLWQSLLHKGKYFICHKIYQMNASTVNIQNNVVTVTLVSMYQTHLSENPFLYLFLYVIRALQSSFL